MGTRVKLMSLVAMALGATLQFATVASAQPAGVTKDEFKCESLTGGTLAKFVGAKGKCVQKCLGTARKTSGPYAGCFAPFADPATNTCVNDPIKGAESKARAGIVKACTKDCPECYAPTVCSAGEPFVSNTETQLDGFSHLVYCKESGATTPSAAEAKCEDTVSKSLAKFVGSKTKCYSKCGAAAFAGKISQSACTPPASDPATQACINLAESKTAAAIDKLCSAVGAVPSCYGTSLDTGAEWAAAVESAVDAQNPIVACGSPSGAFID
jgi:hypothetical protein